MQKTILSLLVAGLLMSPAVSSVVAQEKKVWITLGDAAFNEYKKVRPSISPKTTVQKAINQREGIRSETEGVHLVQVSESELATLSGVIHKALNRCGGFIQHSSEAEGIAALNAVPPRFVGTTPNYVIDNSDLVKPILAQMQASNIAQTILDLSTTFANRYYKTNNGVKASDWIANRWKQLSSGRSDISVEQFTHPSWPQKSVILTITGTESPNEVIVMGAHLDSINLKGTTETTIAPGADDDASGIASLTEVLRALVASNYKPRRTIKLMGYAAEEVGLLGSKEIAASFSAKNTNVVGVVQLDMTNYKGSSSDIYLYTDYTNGAQNDFMVKLINTYQPGVTIGYDKCGYACSDHASWYNKGYPTSMPFEATFSQDNKNIHTSNDTLAASGGNADHSIKFARLAASFAVELGSDGPGVADKVENFDGSLTKGQSKSFGPFNVAAGGKLTASTTGTGDIDLYVKKGSVATSTSNDCKSAGSSATEKCSVSAAAASSVYVLVSGYSAGTYKLQVSYKPQ